MFLANTKFLVVLFFTCGIICRPPTAQAQTICGQQPAVSVNHSLYKVHNNEFGSAAQECIEVNGTLFSIIESSISNSKSSGPGAYPSIYLGCHWGRCTSKSGLPVQVDSIANAISDWSTTQPSSGTYAAAYDIWFKYNSWNERPARRRRDHGLAQPQRPHSPLWKRHR